MTIEKEHTMKKIQFNKRSIVAAAGAAIAAAAAPALLVAGAAPAQAQTGIWTVTDAFGVTVNIQSTGPQASSGWCNYTAMPKGPGVPVHGLPFYLQANQTHKLWFPGVQSGTTWDVAVTCPNGMNSALQQVVY